MALDYLVKSVGVRNDDSRSEHKAKTINFTWETESIKLAKPETFMNLSCSSNYFLKSISSFLSFLQELPVENTVFKKEAQ